MELKKFLEIKGNEAELNSHRKFPENKYTPTLSGVNSIQIRLAYLTLLLNDLYEIEEEGEKIWLVPKVKLEIKEK